jgi:hypothetical protein
MAETKLDPRSQAFEALAQGIIKQLERRGMEGRYFATAAEAKQAVLEQIDYGATVASGGSATLKEIGVSDELEACADGSGRFTFLSRSEIVDAASRRAHYAKVADADWFLMSTNAITFDGMLVNLDGSGTRAAYLIYGPQHVIVVAGRNKCVRDLDSAISRTRNLAAPANTARLHCNTPCTKTGMCGDCLAPDCICSHLVVTRHCSQPGRIQVFLVNEDLGF